MRPSTACPLQVTDATPCSTLSGLSSVIRYSVPPPHPGDLEPPSIRWGAGVDEQPAELGPHPQDVPGGGKVAPAAGAGHKGVPRPAEGGVVGTHHKLAVGIGLALPHLYFIILRGGTQGPVKFYCPPSPAQHGLDAPRLGIALQIHPALPIHVRADFPPVRRDAPEIPRPVP